MGEVVTKTRICDCCERLVPVTKSQQIGLGWVQSQSDRWEITANITIDYSKPYCSSGEELCNSCRIEIMEKAVDRLKSIEKLVSN